MTDPLSDLLSASPLPHKPQKQQEEPDHPAQAGFRVEGGVRPRLGTSPSERIGAIPTPGLFSIELQMTCRHPCPYHDHG